MLETKDVVTILLSSLALIISAVNFFKSFYQRAAEDRKNTKKELNTTLAQLSEVNIAYNKLYVEYPDSTDDSIVGLRRQYNGRRRVLANHCEFLFGEIPELTTDVDCVFLAEAFSANRDLERAEKFYLMAVEKSPNEVLKCFNLRSMALFQFSCGNAERARQYFEQSVNVNLPDTDNTRDIKSDTYLMWAKREFDNGFFAESTRLKDIAISTTNRISKASMRDYSLARIRDMFAAKPEARRSA